VCKDIGSKSGFEIESCSKCGSIYTAQLPEAGAQENYDEYYSEANLSVPEFIKTRVKEIVEEFEPYRLSNRLLDIGFGAGTVLETAAEKNWNVSGLEVSGPAIDHARARGFDVFKGFLREAKYPSDHFDVVTASEILEHLDAPLVDLAEIARILRPGGLFWATTPSATGISRRVMGVNWSVVSPPEHTQLYSKCGIEAMLRRTGFKVAAIRAYGTNPLEIVNYFRPGRKSAAQFNRVETAYSLNEGLTKSAGRRIIKNVLNFALNATGMGDSLKIYAVKQT
jgi:2-polyprenyl-3-methyl-5-hydroxy-6-metoxy-1,4-benzoquinol methylase